MSVKINRESRSVKDVKLEELSNANHLAILAGFDHAGEHYSMTLEDQTNMVGLTGAAAQGQSVPYHADGKDCRMYTAEEFIALSGAAMADKIYKTAYYNHLRQWVNRTANYRDVQAITYGAELPADLKASMAELLGNA
jgi:hypothetical protein